MYLHFKWLANNSYIRIIKLRSKYNQFKEILINNKAIKSKLNKINLRYGII